MKNFIPVLMFCGAFLSIMIALGQLFQKKKELISYIYAFSFLGLGLWIFQMSLYSTGLIDNYQYISVWLIPVSFLTAPLMALRYRWVIVNRFIADWRYLLLGIPCIASVIFLLFPLFSGSVSYDRAYMGFTIIFSEPYLKLPLYYKILHLLYPLPKFYLVIAMIPTLVTMSVVWKKSRSRRSQLVSRMGYVFSIFIILSTALLAFGDLFSRELVQAAVLMANATLSSVFVATQRHPDFNRLLRIETRKAHYTHSKIRGLDLDSIVLRLEEIMDQEKAFADEELSLASLADELEITAHQLSQILNQKLKRNFNSFVNEYRIAEAKKMIIEEPDRSILSIGAAVGFNSNTTFCTVFSRMEGVSPGHYRKSHSGKSGTRSA